MRATESAEYIREISAFGLKLRLENTRGIRQKSLLTVCNDNSLLWATWSSICDSLDIAFATHLVDLLKHPGQLSVCCILGSVSSYLEHSCSPTRPKLAHHLRKQDNCTLSVSHQHVNILPLSLYEYVLLEVLITPPPSVAKVVARNDRVIGHTTSKTSTATQVD